MRAYVAVFVVKSVLIDFVETGLDKKLYDLSGDYGIDNTPFVILKLSYGDSQRCSLKDVPSCEGVIYDFLCWSSRTFLKV